MDPETGIELHTDHDQWAATFEEEGVVLLEALGESVRAIEHVGCTAVPELPARPVIDILIGVDALEGVSRHVVAVQQLGYEYRGEAGVSERLLFRKRNGVGVDASVVLHGSELWRRRLTIRDHLRDHPDTAAQFGRQKRRLADQVDDIDAFEEAKADQLDDLVGELDF